MLKRSVLTEKIARRGLHLTREYAIDPLEGFFVHEVMHSSPVVLDQSEPVDGKLLARLDDDPAGRHQSLFPVVGENGSVRVTTRGDLRRYADDTSQPVRADDIARPLRASAGPYDTLRQIAYLFAETGLTSAPVLDPDRRVLGIITLPHLLHARLHDLTEEHHRQRVLPAAAPTRQPVSAPSATGSA